MLKIMTILGTRPEIIRLSRIIPKLDACCEHILVNTQQNYDEKLNDNFFTELDLREPNDLFPRLNGNPGEVIGSIVAQADYVLRRHKPDAVLILGDTHSALSAIAAKHLGIPIFHMEAGNRCFDDRVPEEINRRIVDHIADYHLPYSRIAREYLLREGIAPDRIVVTGSPLNEVINYNAPKIASSTILQTMGLTPGQYYVVSVHRKENTNSPEKFIALLNHLALDNLPVLVSLHPSMGQSLRSARQQWPVSPNVVMHLPFSFCGYAALQMNAKAVLSDSGSITEEASLLGLKALSLRNVTERPEGLEEAAVMLAGMNVDRVAAGLKWLEQESVEDRQLVADYAKPNTSDIVISTILSYARMRS